MKTLKVSLALCVFIALVSCGHAIFEDLVQHGTPAEVQEAIDRGANVNQRDWNNGATPIVFAAQDNADPEVLEVLVLAGAKLDSRDSRGETPLFDAARSNPNAEVTSFLLKAGARVEDRDKLGRTPLIEAARRNPNPEVIMTLLKAGAKVNETDNEKMTPLMWAANDGNSGVIRTLLDAGADETLRSIDGKTAIDYARRGIPLRVLDLFRRILTGKN